MIIERCHDETIIKKILTTPCVWETINDFDLSVEDVKADFSNEVYLLIKDGCDYLGLYVLKNITSYIIDIHPAIIKKYRRKCAYKSFSLLVSYIKENFKHIKALTGFIPDVYKNVISFAIGVGFKRVGVIPDSTIRKNKTHNIVVVYRGL